MHLGGTGGYDVPSAPDIHIMHQFLVGSVRCCWGSSRTVEHRFASCNAQQTDHQEPQVQYCTLYTRTLHAELHIVKQEVTSIIEHLLFHGALPRGVTPWDVIDRHPSTFVRCKVAMSCSNGFVALIALKYSVSFVVLSSPDKAKHSTGLYLQQPPPPVLGPAGHPQPSARR